MKSNLTAADKICACFFKRTFHPKFTLLRWWRIKNLTVKRGLVVYLTCN
ncbi:hypothetical protein CAMRE0001_1544 [Campylobacter rectus RM3267]|uniref:Uncharacterized protein n=1 Tax=Campylobacter rectus RM3267 TaxID=553218 RepID=B9CZI5_CAMRE|nr:hypothetical protein CAMRE0001_1544 [Campylobacter rectus RM3267]